MGEGENGVRLIKSLWLVAFISITAAVFLHSDNIKTGLIHALVAIGIFSIITIICAPICLGIKRDFDRDLL